MAEGDDEQLHHYFFRAVTRAQNESIQPSVLVA